MSGFFLTRSSASPFLYIHTNLYLIYDLSFYDLDYSKSLIALFVSRLSNIPYILFLQVSGIYSTCFQWLPWSSLILAEAVCIYLVFFCLSVINGDLGKTLLHAFNLFCSFGMPTSSLYPLFIKILYSYNAWFNSHLLCLRLNFHVSKML